MKFHLGSDVIFLGADLGQFRPMRGARGCVMDAIKRYDGSWYYHVQTASGPDVREVPEDCLEEAPSDYTEACRCAMRELMRFGCQCGAMTSERWLAEMEKAYAGISP